MNFFSNQSNQPLTPEETKQNEKPPQDIENQNNNGTLVPQTCIGLQNPHALYDQFPNEAINVTSVIGCIELAYEDTNSTPDDLYHAIQIIWLSLAHPSQITEDDTQPYNPFVINERLIKFATRNQIDVPNPASNYDGCCAYHTPCGWWCFCVGGDSTSCGEIATGGAEAEAEGICIILACIVLCCIILIPGLTVAQSARVTMQLLSQRESDCIKLIKFFVALAAGACSVAMLNDSCGEAIGNFFMHVITGLEIQQAWIQSLFYYLGQISTFTTVGCAVFSILCGILNLFQIKLDSDIQSDLQKLSQTLLIQSNQSVKTLEENLRPELSNLLQSTRYREITVAYIKQIYEEYQQRNPNPSPIDQNLCIMHFPDMPASNRSKSNLRQPLLSTLFSSNTTPLEIANNRANEPRNH